MRRCFIPLGMRNTPQPQEKPQEKQQQVRGGGLSDKVEEKLTKLNFKAPQDKAVRRKNVVMNF